MTTATDAVIAGHMCLDIAPMMTMTCTKVDDIFRPGKLIHVGNAAVTCGGPVSNTGLGLHRLGTDVKLMGKVGNDMFGRALVERIKAEIDGAEAGMQVVDGETTSYTVVVCPPGIDRMFMHCPGANDTFGSGDVDVQVVKRARLFHFGYPPLMEKVYANDGQELALIFEQAKATGATTSLDMALPDPAGPSGRIDWSAVLEKTLPHCDLFLPSAEELTFMWRRDTFDALLARAGNSDLLAQMSGELLSDLARRSIDAGAAVVVIKCGYLGAYIRTAGQERLASVGRAQVGDLDDWAHRELFEPSYHVANMVSATGSGDSAIAGFLAAYLNGCGVADAMRYACAVGAQNVQVRDAVSGIKSWAETTEFVRSNADKNEPDIPMDGWTYDETSRHHVGPNDKNAA